jgi:RNase P/RNase MRP subunit p29
MADYLPLREFLGRNVYVMISADKFTVGKLVDVQKELIIIETTKGEKHVVTDFIRVEVKP